MFSYGKGEPNLHVTVKCIFICKYRFLYITTFALLGLPILILISYAFHFAMYAGLVLILYFKLCCNARFSVATSLILYTGLMEGNQYVCYWQCNNRQLLLRETPQSHLIHIEQHSGCFSGQASRLRCLTFSDF